MEMIDYVIIAFIAGLVIGGLGYLRGFLTGYSEGVEDASDRKPGLQVIITHKKEEES